MAQLIPTEKWQTKDGKRYITLDEAMKDVKAGDTITRVVEVVEIKEGESKRKA